MLHGTCLNVSLTRYDVVSRLCCCAVPVLPLPPEPVKSSPDSLTRAGEMAGPAEPSPEKEQSLGWSEQQ